MAQFSGELTNRKIGERDIEVLLISDNEKTKEINIGPLDKSADEIKEYLKKIQ